MNIQRIGIDHDPIRPWMLATMPMRAGFVEILSYPVPPPKGYEPPPGPYRHDRGWMIMVRMTPGDPSTLREVPLRTVACLDPDRVGEDELPKNWVYGGTD